MIATEKMINDMIQTLDRKLGEEHFSLCLAWSECLSQEASDAIWTAIEKSHLNVLQTYLKVVLGQDGINTLIRCFGSEEEIHEIICEETGFFMNEPTFYKLYDFIPELLYWVEETQKELSEEQDVSDEETYALSPGREC